MHGAVAALCVCAASVWGTFIALRDENLAREDARIVQELRRRSYQAAEVRLPAPPSPAASSPRTPITDLIKRRDQGVKNHRFKADPVVRASKHKAIELVAQAVYGAQYRLKDIEPILRKYRDRLEFRLAFLYKRLEEIERHLEIIYSRLEIDINKDRPNRRRTFLYIVHYEVVLMMFVDVQYICENIFAWHADERRRLRARQRMSGNHTTGNASLSSPGPANYEIVGGEPDLPIPGGGGIHFTLGKDGKLPFTITQQGGAAISEVPKGYTVPGGVADRYPGFPG